MAKVGYARVSSVDQCPDRQIEQLKDVDKLFVDRMTGSTIKRPELDSCRSYVREGDTLYVASIDRLARNLADLQKLVSEFRSKGVTVHFLKENLIFGIEAESPINALLFQVLGAISEFERSLIKERQAQGIALAKKKGTRLGRPHSLKPEQVEDLRSKAANGESHSKLAKEFGLSRTTVWRLAKVS